MMKYGYPLLNGFRGLSFLDENTSENAQGLEIQKYNKEEMNNNIENEDENEQYVKYIEGNNNP